MAAEMHISPSTGPAHDRRVVEHVVTAQLHDRRGPGGARHRPFGRLSDAFPTALQCSRSVDSMIWMFPPTELVP